MPKPLPASGHILTRAPTLTHKALITGSEYVEIKANPPNYRFNANFKDLFASDSRRIPALGIGSSQRSLAERKGSVAHFNGAHARDPAYRGIGASGHVNGQGVVHVVCGHAGSPG